MKFDPSLRLTKQVFQRVKETPKDQFPKNTALLIAVSFFVLLLSQFFSGVTIALLGYSADDILPMLYGTSVTTICCLVYCSVIEKRTLRSLGFTRHHAIPQYLIGIFLGVLMLGGAVMLAKAFGAMEYKGLTEPIAWKLLTLFFFGWVLQGMSEEVFCRSQLLMGIGVYQSPWVAILLSAGIFTALHFGNPNTSLLAFLNLFLFGIFSALLFLRTDNIWMVSAVHSLWNCAQGNLFGIEVSGLKIETTVLNFAPLEGMDIISGGAFGIEGGLCATIVLTIGSVLLLFTTQKQEAASASEAA